MTTDDETRDKRITDLAKEVAAGEQEEEAMNAFVEETINDLRAMVESRWLQDDRLKGRVAASDIVQSAYRRFLVYCRDSESIIRDGKALLYQNAHFSLLNRVREYTAEMRDPSREVRGDAVVDALSAGGPTPSAVAIRNEDLTRLKLAMAEYTAEDQALLLWKAEVDGKWEDLATEVGLSVDALKQRYYRLLKRLKVDLSERE